MARYIIEGDDFVKINETYGTIENLSDFEAQVYTSPNRDEGIILYPRARLSFNQPIYVARASGESGTPVVATLPFNYYYDSSGNSIHGDNEGVNVSINNGASCCTGTDTGSCSCCSDVITVPAQFGSGVSNTECCTTCCSTVVFPENYYQPSSVSNCGGGSLKLQVPMVININMPQTINVPSASQNSDDDDDADYNFKEQADSYFDSKQADGSYTLTSSSYNFKAMADKYFNEKD